jgi:glutaredoxin 3
MKFFYVLGLLFMYCTSMVQSLSVQRAAPRILSTKLFHTYSSKETAVAHIKASKIVVFSKTHCPYCKKAKEAIGQLTPQFSIIELDVVKDGPEQQAALLEITGQKTVPNIFVDGKHIGGCDKTLELIASGDFQKLIAA